MHTVNPNPIRCQLIGEGSREAGDAVFAGRVVAQAHQAPNTSYRASQHDRPSTSTGDHPRNSSADCIPRPLQVGVDHRVPRLLGDLPQRTVRSDAGIGDAYIDPAHRPSRPLNQLGHIAEASDVADRAHDSTTLAFYHLYGLVEV